MANMKMHKAVSKMGHEMVMNQLKSNKMKLSKPGLSAEAKAELEAYGAALNAQLGVLEKKAKPAQVAEKGE